jgi:Cu-Zn family superoxide dismutase
MKLELTAENKTVTGRATAEIAGPDVKGTATLTEYTIDDGVYVHIRVELDGDPKSLPEGKHAVHFHEKAACDCDGFKCAGGHFDPGPSGNTDPDANHGYHMGDLPGITVDSNGHGEMEAITTRVTLSKSPVSLLDKESAPEGTSIMIHGNADPHTPGESGSGHSGGPRLACGTIEAA